jgi:hypothetical protein
MFTSPCASLVEVLGRIVHDWVVVELWGGDFWQVN